MREREQVGLDKYGKSIDRNDLKPEEWLVHLQEELMDGIQYLERALIKTVELESENYRLRQENKMYIERLKRPL